MSDDTIYRQDAIDSLDCINGVEEVLRSLPSAQSERKKGEWDDIGGVIRYGCPFCHNAQERKSNYCPHCGADMRGEQDA